MGILAARADGWETVFYDEKAEAVPLDLEADLVALSIETYTACRGYQIADAYRARGVPVVLGGYHASFLPDEAIQHADAVVVGDAEGAWERLLDDILRNRLTARYTGNNSRPLDDFRIDRSIYRDKSYAPVEVVQFGRGCRFACDFCSIHSFYGSNIRSRNVCDVIAEIEELPSQKLLFFVDDNLFGHRADFQELLTELKPLKRRWACQISIDVARDESLLDELAESGCRFVLIGFESLRPANLRQMGKRWNTVSGSYSDVVRALHRRGIGIYGMFVFGYDADTPDVFERTLEFAVESRLEVGNFNPLTPMPGSRLYDRLANEGRLLFPNWWVDPGYRYGEAIFEPRGMRSDELTEGVFDVRRRFYSWRSIGKRVIDCEVPFTLFHRGMTSLANLISRREILRKQCRPLGV